MAILQLTLHVSGEPVLVGEAVIRPLLPEGDLHAVLHLDIIDLGEAPDEQVDHDQGGVICNQRESVECEDSRPNCCHLLH